MRACAYHAGRGNEVRNPASASDRPGRPPPPRRRRDGRRAVRTPPVLCAAFGVLACGGGRAVTAPDGGVADAPASGPRVADGSGVAGEGRDGPGGAPMDARGAPGDARPAGPSDATPAGAEVGSQAAFVCPATPAPQTACAVRLGLTCTGPGAGGAPLTCTCSQGPGMSVWRCGENACPAAPAPGAACAVAPGTLLTDACRYPDQSECRCTARLADRTQTRWTCSAVSAACGEAPRAGGCDYAPEGATCRFHGGDTTCVCTREAAGGRRWYCNGRPTPDCPAGLQGSGGDCSAFPPDTRCFGASTCTCQREGDRQTWSCAPVNPA
jgi:hypothetical protein